MSDHHRQLIRFSIEHLVFLEGQVERIDQEIRRKILEAGFQRAFQLLQTIPGVKEDAAAGSLAEVEAEMRARRQGTLGLGLEYALTTAVVLEVTREAEPTEAIGGCAACSPKTPGQPPARRTVTSRGSTDASPRKAGRKSS